MSFAFYNGIRLQREPHDAPYLQKECTIPDHTDLKQSIENIDALPAMLTIAKKMLALDLDTDTGETQLLKLIAQDPQISTRIIGLIQCIAIRFARHNLIGLQIKSVAIGMATITAFTQQPEEKLKSEDLWVHSIIVTSIMYSIARRQGFVQPNIKSFFPDYCTTSAITSSIY